MEPRVLIVGGGPVGLTLALVLACFGVASCVIEAREAATPRDESRAITWQPRGIELLEWLGVRETVAAHAVRRTRHVFRAGGRDRLVLHLDAVDSTHPYTLDLPQGDSERILEAAARETGLVELRRGHRALGAVDSRDEAIVSVAGLGGSSYTATAPWGVVCDGYHSTLRGTLGIGVRHVDYGADSAVADVLTASAILPEGVSDIVLDARRPYGFFRFGTDRWRIVYRINPDEDRAALTHHDRVLELVRERAPDAHIERVLWASAFRLGQQQSNAYRKDRWLLAGDAAHGMGPSAGAGLQIGALGAWRLGWRLALAASGHPRADALLDDYAREQRVASGQVQASNGLIFRNLALRAGPLSALRGVALSVIGAIPAIGRRMTADMTLVAQHVPVAGAQDRVPSGAGWRAVEACGEWRAGRRAPAAALAGALAHWTPSTQAVHRIVPIGGDATRAAQLAQAIAATIAVPAETVEGQVGGGRPSVAIVRPDQEVAALVQADA